MVVVVVHFQGCSSLCGGWSGRQDEECDKDRDEGHSGSDAVDGSSKRRRRQQTWRTWRLT